MGLPKPRTGDRNPLTPTGLAKARAPMICMALRQCDRELMDAVCKARSIGKAEFWRRVLDHARETEMRLLRAGEGAT